MYTARNTHEHATLPQTRFWKHLHLYTKSDFFVLDFVLDFVLFCIRFCTILCIRFCVRFELDFVLYSDETAGELSTLSGAGGILAN